MKRFIILLFALTLVFSADAQKKFDNEIYFRVGYSNPCWRQFGADRDWWPDNTNRWGLTGEFGTIFMLTTLGKQETMALGLDVDWISFYWQQFHLDNTIPFDIVTFQFNQKVGPLFTIMPTDKIAIDIYAKAVVSWFAASAFIENEDTDDAEGYGRVFTIGYSTGANFRFSILMVGVEFCSIRPKLENFDDPDKIFGNLQTDSDRTPLPSMNFTVGLSF